MRSPANRSLDELWRIVQEQQATIRLQSSRINAQEAALRELRSQSASYRPAAVDHTRNHAHPSGKISRAGLLKAAAVGAVGSSMVAGSGLVGGAKPAFADGTEGQTEFTSSLSPTVLILNTDAGGIGLEMIGPVGEDSSYQNIYTKVEEGRAVTAISAHGTAIEADAVTGTALSASCIAGAETSNPVIAEIQNTGLAAQSQAAVRAKHDVTSANGIGVWGSHAGGGRGAYFTSVKGIGVSADGGSGRGAVASGQSAQVRLIPSKLKTHPRAGLVGDLFVDSSARLWLCTKTGNPARWRRIHLV